MKSISSLCLRGFALLSISLVVQATGAQTGFYNFESAPVNPLAITPDGTKLLACNTADNRLEVFSLVSGTPVRIASVSVGLDPVSVRARSNTEAWVVNTVSDSVSIVDLSSNPPHVKNTISTGDEPMDVVFAGNPQRAFVSVSQLNQVRVYDPATLAQVPGSPLAIQGEDPRALAVSNDGSKVIVAIFESGNRSVIIPASVVSNPASPYGGVNPPPNSGAGFNPPIAAGLPTPPPVGIIVHKEQGHWRDDNLHDWDALVPYNTHDNDAVVINANTLAMSNITGLVLNIVTNLAVNPSNGRVTAVGLYDFNEIRFEPRLKAKFTRVFNGTFDPTSLAVTGGGDLNPHLGTYATLSIPQAQRDLSVGDPRCAIWNAAGTQMYVSGMGSNNVIVTNSSNTRLATINVGNGPTGLALDAAHNRVYCLNRFDATISRIDTATNTEVLPRVSYFDPTPTVIKSGRPFLYNTHQFSGLGQVSCGTCHLDGKMDNEAWDLGDPSGSVKTFNQQCNGGLPPPFSGQCGNWHPMKGPMTTQTLVGSVGNGGMHWRSDREDLMAFSPAFVSLLGGDASPSNAAMTQMQDFLATIHFPPQPNRSITDGLPASLPSSMPGFTGNPTTGQSLFTTTAIDGGAITCVTCHTLGMGGANSTVISANLLQESQSMKVPQLRNLYEKTGFFTTSTTNNRGFGFIHDGSNDTLVNFLRSPVFAFAAGAAGDQQRRDIEAFLMCFPTGTHPAVGVQTTVLIGSSIPDLQQTLINQMISLASSGAVGLVVKGTQGGIDRGYVFTNGQFQSDRAAESLPPATLQSLAGRGSELTYTIVAAGTQVRIGIDRDADGYFDRDEIDKCSNPADPLSIPAPNALCRADVAPPGGNGIVNVDDLLVVINNWGATSGPADIAPGCGNGIVNVDDLLAVINAWGACP